MAYGDVNFSWHASGSAGAAASTAHGLFGSYSGLSSLEEGEVVHIFAATSVNKAFVGPPSVVSNNKGILLTTTNAELKPMRAADASQLQFVNETGGTNASVIWTIWRRNSL